MKDALLLALMRLGRAVAPRLPRDPSLRVARAVGLLAAHVAPARHAVADNMRHVMGPAAGPGEVRACVRRAFRTQAQNYVDLLRIAGTTRTDLERIVHYSGEEHLAAALRDGHGAVLVSGHVGNLDLIALHIGQMEHTTTAVIERLQPPELMDFVTGLRGNTGIEFVPVDRAARAVVGALRQGHLVYVAADLNLSGSGVTVPFFGRETTLPDAHARLARHHGLPVFFGTAARTDDGRIDAGCTRVELPEFTADVEADVRAIVEAVVALLEETIAADPGQWVMFRRVWPAPGAAPST